MKALMLRADVDPRNGYSLSPTEERTGKVVTGSSVWRHPHLAIEDVAEPSLTADQVLIEVNACGVCGSDVHFYETDSEGYILYPGLTRFPVIPGHEFSGVIVDKGKAVQSLEIGDMVTAEEMIWCGHCDPCRNGFPNHCLNLEEIGFTINGAMGERIAVGFKYCWPISAIAEVLGDEDKAFELGALVEPASVSYNAIFERAGGFHPGAYVAVFGAGPIGLAAIALSLAAGASKIAVFETSSVRRELAAKLGAEFVYDPREIKPSEAMMSLSQGNGFDFFVEAAGAPHLTMPEILQSLAINARVVQIGRAATRVPMYLEQLQVRRAQVFGAQGHSGHANFPNVIRLMASKRLDLAPVITARFGLDQAVEAIQQASRREDGKVLVKNN